MNPPAPSLSAWRQTRWGLLSCWLLLLLLAAIRPLALPDEGRYAEISRWMLVSGDWLVPRLDGLPFFHKPPLLHWLQAGSMAVLGTHPWAARLVPALAAGLMLAGLWVAMRRLTDDALARPPAWILATSPGFLLAGQYINHDMLVAAWISTAIWCFALSFQQAAVGAAGDGALRPHAGWARAGFAACALGVLSKGLIGVVLPGMVIFFWLFATRRWRQVPRLPWFSGLALFAALALPWFWLAAQRYPGLWSYMFGTQQFARYTGTGFNNVQPWWFYLAALLLLLLPWPIFMLFRPSARTGPALAAIKSGTKETQVLCWIWLGVVLLFFSVPRSKLIGYILPALPPLAVLAASAWQRVMAPQPHARRWFAALSMLPLAASVAITVAYGPFVHSKLNGDLAQALACLASPADPVYLQPSGAFPYDLPFLAQTQTPLVVVQDWPALRQSAGDSWARELMDAGDFEPALARQVLQTPPSLASAATAPRSWLIAPRATATGPVAEAERPPAGWRPAFESSRWVIWRSTPEGPEPAQQERLPGCSDHGDAQRGP